MIEGFAFARAGLLGNPSDGYFGKVIAVSIKNFRARVSLEKSRDLRIISPSDEEERYESLPELADKVRLYGYYGSIRLIKAALKKFYEYALSSGVVLPRKNFTVRFTSDIPRQIGLGGSSAIITATMRALMKFYEGCLYMDFDRDLLRDRGYGRYERLDSDLLPPLYLAYKPALGKVSGRVLNEIRIKFDRGDPFTLETLEKLAGLADQGRAAILDRDHARLSRLIDENFELRRSIMTIHPANQELIDTARGCGASAHFSGSGGSILGTFKDEVMFEWLLEELGRLGAIVVKPVFV